MDILQSDIGITVKMLWWFHFFAWSSPQICPYIEQLLKDELDSTKMEIVNLEEQIAVLASLDGISFIKPLRSSEVLTLDMSSL